MEFREYGHEKAETIILLHGGGLSWWNYRNVAEQLQQDFRVILPVLDGHAGSDREFTSIEDNAAEIISDSGCRICLFPARTIRKCRWRWK